MRARDRYSCFDHFGQDTQVYGFLSGTGVTKSCQDEVISELVELQRRAAEYARRDGRVAEEEAFYAEQNARLVKNAEEYYRSMFLSQVSSWNLRDRHMAETLDALASYLSRGGRRAKIVVWADNSHVGDARVTEMGQRGDSGEVMEKRPECLVGVTCIEPLLNVGRQIDRNTRLLPAQ